MSSTRNKNTEGNYQLEQRENSNNCHYSTYIPYALPGVSYHPGDGLLGAKTSRNELSYNACDIESKLFGIGSTNLESPQPLLYPKLRELKSLNMYEKQSIVIPEPFVLDKNRAYRYN